MDCCKCRFVHLFQFLCNFRCTHLPSYPLCGNWNLVPTEWCMPVFVLCQTWHIFSFAATRFLFLSVLFLARTVWAAEFSNILSKFLSARVVVTQFDMNDLWRYSVLSIFFLNDIPFALSLMDYALHSLFAFSLLSLGVFAAVTAPVPFHDPSFRFLEI